MSGYEPIMMVTKQTTHLQGEWPERTQVSLKLLVDQSSMSVDEDGNIEIRLENAWAVYKLDKRQESEHYLCLKFVRGSRK